MLTCICWLFPGVFLSKLLGIKRNKIITKDVYQRYFVMKRSVRSDMYKEDYWVDIPKIGK